MAQKQEESLKDRLRLHSSEKRQGQGKSAYQTLQKLQASTMKEIPETRMSQMERIEKC